jgi:hypothetical protein
MASDLVGRPGLDPGTLGLKVLVRVFWRVAVRLLVSQNCRRRARFHSLSDIDCNAVSPVATHLSGPTYADAVCSTRTSCRNWVQV